MAPNAWFLLLLAASCGARVGSDASRSDDVAPAPDSGAEARGIDAGADATRPADATPRAADASADRSASFPAALLDLRNWKLTLPIASPGGSSPLEVKQPELATYSHDEYFHLNAARDGVVFRAHAGGATTSNSGYPRSELREMADNGASMAA